jgi:hypothetical protein
MVNARAAIKRPACIYTIPNTRAILSEVIAGGTSVAGTLRDDLVLPVFNLTNLRCQNAINPHFSEALVGYYSCWSSICWLNIAGTRCDGLVLHNFIAWFVGTLARDNNASPHPS